MKGIGQSIVKKMLEDHDDKEAGEIFLLTLSRTSPFYLPFGFQILENPSSAPAIMQAEFAIGTNVANIFANDNLVVMKRSKPSK
mmetsp:Transcript_14063/g.34308  ORF Transcript_14063/g.34308 Transcript_14063/m.34308 type:complete len:84 (+) Transcript_14063:586-837(+)